MVADVTSGHTEQSVNQPSDGKTKGHGTVFLELLKSWPGSALSAFLFRGGCDFAASGVLQ